MTAQRTPPDEWLPSAYEDDWVYFPKGRTPYRYLERVAILIDSGLSPYRAQERAAVELANEPGYWDGKPDLNDLQNPRCTERHAGRRCSGSAACPPSMHEGRHVCPDCAARLLHYRCPGCSAPFRRRNVPLADLFSAVDCYADDEGNTFCFPCILAKR